MENASKALIIAGSILIAIMILSLIVYMSTTTSRMMQAQDEKKAEQEIFEFNKEYEAYNKELMYGTDIITVMKKAMEYNRNSVNKIKIELTTKKAYAAVTETITIDGNGEEEKIKSETNEILVANKTYNLDDSDLLDFFEQPHTDKKVTKINERTKKYEYSALTSFKISIFTCTNVSYANDGRINSMKFEEK